MMRKAVANKTQISLLNVLLDGIERKVLGDLARHVFGHTKTFSKSSNCRAVPPVSRWSTAEFPPPCSAHFFARWQTREHRETATPLYRPFLVEIKHVSTYPGVLGISSDAGGYQNTS
jgi:hypothetical protein